MVSRREIWCSRPCVVSDKIITTGTFITTCEPSYYHTNTIRYVVCIASQFIYPHAYTHTHFLRCTFSWNNCCSDSNDTNPNVQLAHIAVVFETRVCVCVYKQTNTTIHDNLRTHIPSAQLHESARAIHQLISCPPSAAAYGIVVAAAAAIANVFV